MRLQPLPSPDWLDTPLPKSPICLLTDDGSISTQLADSLIREGWKVIVLSFPESMIAVRSLLPTAATRIVLKDLSEAHLQQQLDAIAVEHGAISQFIHLHPIHLHPQVLLDRSDGLISSSTDRAIVKLVFLIAKHLKPLLNEAASAGRNRFLTVVRLDGKFGLSHQGNFGAISAGLFGLTKTLNFEWTSVFCRTIDLAPSFDAEQAARLVLAEAHDPNLSIVEVAYSPEGRAMLTCSS
ncbi:hypothetical protein ACQ4M3_26780 [Leptolyngbya sp. AN03gr2]|uniref:hypothetical protein n=1 Tax=unclassified Leptolyngbya TaxID=2650499 RepID=UPI003D316CF5